MLFCYFRKYGIYIFQCISFTAQLFRFYFYVHIHLRRRTYCLLLSMRNYKSWSVVVLKKKKKKYLNYFWLFSCVVLKRESHKIEMVIIAERCESPFKTEPVSLTQLNIFQGVLGEERR